MWDQLPSDLLCHIFAFLPPDSLARAASASRHWQGCAISSSAGRLFHRHPPWFLAMHARDRGARCYARNPALGRWVHLPPGFPPYPVRPVAPVQRNLLLCRLLAPSSLRLAVCNPFSPRSFRLLPQLNHPRSNPALGVVAEGGGGFRVYVAGGMSLGGTAYEPALEVYDSESGSWRTLGPVPPEFAVRLTVWTPNESAYDAGAGGGTLYWVTSARAYSVVALEVGTGEWREVRAPEADRLECAALVARPRWATRRVALVGGVAEGGARLWELGQGDVWRLVDQVPEELSRRFLRPHGGWSTTKCTGSEDGEICLYRELGSGMLVWRENPVRPGRWDWEWADGFREANKFPIRGVLLQPSLAL